MAEWLYRVAMAACALALFIAVARLAAEPERAPRTLIRAEGLVVGSGFIFWLTLATPSARWATMTELLLWIAMGVPCLALWVLSSPPRTPPAEYTPQSTTRSRHLRARYASRTNRS